ncbi:psilocybin cluster transcription regulator [Favolaschia claudopus]|uniref:Psilocybin cluster transcription regulator n=1 Tax=Favolaschia claudopus TaxID=2862362 RepID=A0AAW0AHC7_9AGAR
MEFSQVQADGSHTLPGLDSAQLATILSNLPGIFAKQLADGKGVAQTLSNLAQLTEDGTGTDGSDFGPLSHPHGPPSTVSHLRLLSHSQHTPPPAEPDQNEGDYYVDMSEEPPIRKPAGRGKNRRAGAAVGSEEWARRRKDNHKEVERRRRGNINEGINELARIIPCGAEEKAKSAILSRAVQYIHHLKENEARNIEKWTLEKLLMDHATRDLHLQLDSIRKLAEDERVQHQKLKQEVDLLRGKGKAATEN